MALLGACALAAGCRSVVDVGPDHDRAVQDIRRATGAASVFHPDANTEQAAARVDALLSGTVGMDQAVEVALLNNPGLQASFHAVGMASADRVQAGMFTNPSLGALFRFPASGGSPDIDAGLYAGLLDLWQVPERERVAAGALERHLLQLAQEAVVLAADVRTAFIATVSARQRVELAGENLAVAGQLVELAEARLEAAAGTIIDANLARLEQAATTMALRDAELVAAEAALKLTALLGLSPERELLLDPLLGGAPDTLPPVEALETIATEGRLDVRAAGAALSAAEAELERQRDLTWRHLELGVGSERSDGEWSVGPGVNLELPIFDQNQAQVARALEDVRRAEKVLTATSLAAVYDVRLAAARLRAATHAVALYRDEILVRAEDTLELARRSYQLGKTTILPVIEAQRQVLEARQGAARRRVQAALALSDVERATGTTREALWQGLPQGVTP